MSAYTNIQTVNFNKHIRQNAQMTFRSQHAQVENYPQDIVEIGSDKKDVKRKDKKRKYIVIGLSAFAALGLSYIAGIRIFESRFFKDMAKSVKPQELDLAELKKITKDVTIKSKKGNKINCWDINPNNYERYIINCNGIDAGKSSQDDILRRAKKHKYGFIEFDYCGQGKSTGKFNQEGCYESLETVVNYLKEKGIRDENIVIVGHSMGTGVACDYAAKNNVKGVVLIQPFDKFSNTIKSNVSNVEALPELAKKVIKNLPNWMIPIKNKYNNVKNLKTIKAPTLIITSKDDKVVASDLTRRLYEQTKDVGNKKIIEFESGGHFINEDKEKASFEFIDKLFEL